MSLQGPARRRRRRSAGDLIGTLGTAGAFPLIQTTSDKAADAITAAKPGAILLADAVATRDEKLAAWLSREITPLAPIVPVVACAADDEDIAYREALPVAADATSQFISARLAAALRVRSLHGSVLRRAAMAQDRRPSAARRAAQRSARRRDRDRCRPRPRLSGALGRDRRAAPAPSACSASRLPPAI